MTNELEGFEGMTLGEVMASLTPEELKSVVDSVLDELAMADSFEEKERLQRMLRQIIDAQQESEAEELGKRWKNNKNNPANFERCPTCGFRLNTPIGTPCEACALNAELAEFDFQVSVNIQERHNWNRHAKRDEITEHDWFTIEGPGFEAGTGNREGAFALAFIATKQFEEVPATKEAN